MKNQQKIYVIGLLTFILTLSVSGQSYFSGLGLTQNNGYDARSSSMGLSRTALDQGAWSVTGNPAHLASSNGLNLSISLLLKQINETRSIPAIDQFNDVVTKNVYAANNNTNSHYAFAVDYGFEKFAIAYAWAPVHDFSYAYSEEIRNSFSSSYYNRDLIAGYHTYEMNGQIYGHYLGFASTFKGLSMGVGLVNYAAKDLSILKAVSVLSVDDALASDTSYSHLSSYSIDEAGMGFNIGLTYNITPHTALHYVFDKAGDLSIDTDGLIPFADSTKRYPEYLQSDSSLVYTISTPAVHRMGISFSPGQKQKTIASFEMEFHAGQSISYSDSMNGTDSFDYQLDNYAVFHVGLEHWASPTLPLRIGFSYEESPIDKALSVTRFTVGGSLIVKHFQFDLGGDISSLGYTYPDIFPKASRATNPDLESINESVLNLYLTASYRLP
ncbi:MAG: hypothetical protein U9Q77_04595 [Candidatus Marinimicrobia bacterium]|nr:hypothetical protein [Candidatus Neomarinimicrobiota bacterium]